MNDLPKNLEAEQGLLGCLLFDNAALERVPERLKADHFYEPLHQRLFAVITEAVGQGELAEPDLIQSRFVNDPAYAEFGGLGYLADLVDRAPPAPKAADYAREIYDLAVRRDLIRICQEVGHSALDTAVPAMAHVETAESALFSLAETGEQSKGVTPFADALHGALAQAEAAFRRGGKLTGLSTGLIDLDRKLGGLHPSDLDILAGRPSMGKTSLATNIAFNVAKAYRYAADPDAPNGRKTVDGGQVLFFSLEMSGEQLATRIVSDVANVSGDRIRKGETTEAEIKRMILAGEELRSIPLYIDATGSLPIAKLCARARRQHRRTGLDLIVVDYLQLIVADGKGQGRVQEISQITGALKGLAKELNVPILALSQLSRQVESRDDKRPMLSDLRESGSIEQDADCVMFVYREAYYLGRSEPKPGSPEHGVWSDDMSKVHGLAEVIIGKQRHGPIGTVPLAFDEATTRFGNLARERDEAHYRHPYGDA